MKHFALTSNNGTFVFGVGKFHNLQQLVDHFQNYPIIGGETGLLVARTDYFGSTKYQYQS